MFLPGTQFQPETRSTWSTGSTAVEDKYMVNKTRNSYNFDPIFMGDGKEYTFRMVMNDIKEHNFFL